MRMSFTPRLVFTPLGALGKLSQSSVVARHKLPQGPVSLGRQIPEIAENADEKLSNHMRRLLNFVWRGWKGSQSQIEILNIYLQQIANSNPRYLRSPKWVHWFQSRLYLPSARHGFQERAGICSLPRTGAVAHGRPVGKEKLLGISVRGNPYLRTMFIAALHVKRAPACPC